MIEKLTHEPLSLGEQRLNEVIDSVNEMRDWLCRITVLVDKDAVWFEGKWPDKRENEGK